MWTALFTVPVQIACHLISSGINGTGNESFVVDTQLQGGDNWVLPNFGLKSPSGSTTTLPENYTAFPDIGVAYKYYTDEVSWNEARKICIADGSALAELDSFEKLKHAVSLKNNDDHGLCVGIHRLFDNSEWISLRTGLGVSMIPWANESNNDNKMRNCMAAWFDGRGLTAVECTAEWRFICEIPL